MATNNQNEHVSVNPIQYFARYASEQGRRQVQRCASKIIEDADETDYTIFESTVSDARCLANLKRSTDVLSVEVDHPAWAFASPIDFSTESSLSRTLAEHTPWGIQNIQADQLPQGDANVTICVVDTGVAASHPDLNTERINGTSPEGKEYWRWDQDRAGHGTHVAGTIAAAANNGVGVKGVGNFNLFVVRALSDSMTGHESDIWKAVQVCIDNNVDIINLSLGTAKMSNIAKELYTKAVEEHGIVMVAAAGNTADDTKYYPASHPSVVSVGGTSSDGDGKRHFGSVMNDQVEFVAPGDKILSTSVASHALHTPDGFGYAAHRVVGVPEYAVSGYLVECNVGKTCDDADGGGICLFNIGGSDGELEDAVEGCMEGGGKGAVFFNDERPMDKIDNLYVVGTNTIPVICVSKATGLELIEKLDDNEDSSFKVTIGDTNSDRKEYIWKTLSGTSMAAPHVTASFALLKSHFPECTNHQLRYALALNAEHPEGGCDEEHGYGTVKVKDTFEWISEQKGCEGWGVPHTSSGGCSTL
ncbi:MAG: hypothetical protein SGILL_008109 [Bacillariaceae sp.]